MKSEFNWGHIIQYYGHKLDLKKRGNSYIALSPFTNEKKASFVITPSKDIWKDFSSGRGGKGPYSFIKEIEELSDWEKTHEFVYKQYGIISEY
jgi:DNA primase